MMMYKTDKFTGQVTLVEVESASAGVLVLPNGQKVQKITEFDCYFETQDEARAHILKNLRANVTSAQTVLEHAWSKLVQFEQKTTILEQSTSISRNLS
jgi:hypothetical protein